MHLPYLSTCTGIGGLCAVLPNKISADVWSVPKEIYQANNPGAIYLSGQYGNLYALDLETMNKTLANLGQAPIKRGKVGGYTSGSSCQDMSAMGPYQMSYGIRNFLMLEQVRFTKEFLPQWAVWEQVPGLLDNIMTPFRKLLFEIIKRDLGSDYRIEVAKLNAMHYGSYQDRERLIFMFVRKDIGKIPSYPKGQQVQSCQYLSSLIPEAVAFKTGKEEWKSADRVVGTMTRGGVKILLKDGSERSLTIDEKKMICGFKHMTFNVPGITDESKHEILGNSVAYQLGVVLNRHCLKEYQGITE